MTYAFVLALSLRAEAALDAFLTWAKTSIKRVKTLIKRAKMLIQRAKTLIKAFGGTGFAPTQAFITLQSLPSENRPYIVVFQTQIASKPPL